MATIKIQPALGRKILFCDFCHQILISKEDTEYWPEKFRAYTEGSLTKKIIKLPPIRVIPQFLINYNIPTFTTPGWTWESVHNKFYSMLTEEERKYAPITYLDYFARKGRLGWCSVGNELHEGCLGVGAPIQSSHLSRVRRIIKEQGQNKQTAFKIVNNHIGLTKLQKKPSTIKREQINIRNGMTLIFRKNR